ncbi:hypothetical protein KCV07_g7394, partial [Aureobasidium melanogenum]
MPITVAQWNSVGSQLQEADLEAQVQVRTRNQHQEKLGTRGKSRSNGAYLDGLRGIAMLAVFNYHLLGDGQSAEDNAATASAGILGLLYASWTRLSYMGGNSAVCFFFILTGYVLSLSPLSALANNQRKQCRVKILVGALRRPLRLYLPVLIIAFGAAILMQLPYNVFPDALWHKREDNLYRELSTFLRLSWGFFQPMRTVTEADHYAYDPVLWTIPITLKGSLLVYAVLMLFTVVPLSKPYITGILWGTAIILLHIAYWWQACFIAGLAIAVLGSKIGSIFTSSTKPQSRIDTALGYVAVMTSLYLLSAPSYDAHPELAANILGWKSLVSRVPSAYTVHNYYRFWHSYGAFILIFGLQYTSIIQQVLTTPPIQYLGNVSFMFYAIHMPFFLCIGDRWKRVLGRIPFMVESTWYDNLLRIPEWGPKALNLRVFVVYTSILGMVLVLSRWATTYIDEPCGRLCKKVGEGLEKRGLQ